MIMASILEGHSRLSSPTTKRSYFISKDINNSTTTRKTQQRVLIYRSRQVQTCQDRSIQVQLQTGPEAAVSLHHSLNYYENQDCSKKKKKDRKENFIVIYLKKTVLQLYLEAAIFVIHIKGH